MDSSTTAAYENAKAGLTAVEACCLEYMWATMPASDRDNYPLALFVQFARHAAMVRERYGWCAALPDAAFLDYVAYHRINDEDISFNRGVFYEQLAPRIEGLPVEQAVLEVNRWCHEIATYQQQDERTASPLTVYTSGSGRCGEESAFAVSALRSVGIAARQVYVPRWSHCEDNHAWVEALCGDRWRFFGACEPEPVLDRGWFNAAASRALVVNSRRFSPAGSVGQAALDGEALDRRGDAGYHNQLPRYAATQCVTFTVQKGGVPVVGARLAVEILNQAELCPLFTLVTDDKGEAAATLGKGDLHLRAWQGDCYGEAFCRGSQGQTACVVELADSYTPAEGWQTLDIAAPVAGPFAPALNPAQKQERQATLQVGNAKRTARLEAFFDEARAAALGGQARAYLQAARGNFGQIAAFLEKDDSPLRMQLLGAISEKDLRDTTAEILEDHLAGAQGFAGAYPPEVFVPYLLNPRVASERLTAWRTPLSAAFEKERADFLRTPPLLWQRLGESSNQPGHPGLYWTPENALKAGAWDEKSRAVLFVALLRAWGLPARLGPVDKAPEYWGNGGFVPVEASGGGTTHTLTLKRGDGEVFTYYQNWTLARFDDGEWQTLWPAEDWQGDTLAMDLPAGEYRLLTTVRLPNGNQFAAKRDVSLWGDQTVDLLLRGYRVEDLLTSQALPAFGAVDASGNRVENPHLGAGRCTLLFWLAPGEEPSEHLLNELLEAAQKVDDADVQLVALLRDEAAAGQATMARVIARFPQLRLLFGEWEYNLENLARSLYRDPESPPLAVCCDRQGLARYASSGYNVGLVEFLLQTVGLV